MIDRLATDLVLNPDQLLDELRLSCEAMRLSDPRVVPLVQRLRARGLRVFIATDNMDVFDLWTVPALRLDTLFDGVLNSARIGSLKDDSVNETLPFFQAFFAEQGATYRDCLLLDDSEDRSGRYAALGFRRILIRSPSAVYDHLNALHRALD